MAYQQYGLPMVWFFRSMAHQQFWLRTVRLTNTMAFQQFGSPAVWLTNSIAYQRYDLPIVLFTNSMAHEQYGLPTVFPSLIQNAIWLLTSIHPLFLRDLCNCRSKSKKYVIVLSQLFVDSFRALSFQKVCFIGIFRNIKSFKNLILNKHWCFSNV